MIQFILQEYALRWERILDASQKFAHRAATPTGHEHLMPEEFRFLATVESDLQYICSAIQPENANVLLVEFGHIINRKPCSYQTVNALLEGIVNAIRRDTGEIRFAFIPKEKVPFFDKGKNEPFYGDEPLFGEKICETFPQATQEIRLAGTCLAMELHDAAVFHLMRVVNIGLRKLAKSVGVKRIDGKKLEYCRDASIIEKAEKEIDKKLESVDSLKRGEKWETKKALYDGLLIDLQYFKDVVRDPVAHARKSYTENGAFDVYHHVRDFMQRLTVCCSKPKPKNLKPGKSMWSALAAKFPDTTKLPK